MRYVRQAMTAPIDNPDITLPTLRNEPMLNALPKDPMEPMDKADPREPIDSTESWE